MWLLLACSNPEQPFDPGALELPDPADLPAQSDPPDVLSFFDGSAVGDRWDDRRSELRTLFQHYVYGYVPDGTGVEASVLASADASDADATLEEVELDHGAGTLRVALWIPDGKGPFPVLLGLNKCGNHSTSFDSSLAIARFWVNEDCDNSEAGRGLRDDSWPAADVVAAGFILATVHQSDLDPDDVEDTGFEDGIHPHLDAGGPSGAEWGSIGAWSWGLSRVVDHLVERDDVDVDRIGVIGHSRRGKAALWAAALDERIALAIPHQSGTGGATLSRSYNGEPVAAMNVLFPTWFPDNFKAFGDREEHLPVDQHMLLAMIAPRRVLVTNGDADLWADPEGAQRAVDLAQPVFDLVGGEVDWHSRPGGHSLEPRDWETFVGFAR